MLADEIAAASGGAVDFLWNGGVSALAKDLESAERFDFSPEAVMACKQLAASKPSSILAALPRCRAPFKRCWFEWVPGTLWDDFRAPGSDPLRDIAIPKRAGVMLECLDETHQRIGMGFVWMHDRALRPDAVFLHLCQLGIVFNWHDGWPLMTRHAFVNGRRGFTRDQARAAMAAGSGKRPWADSPTEQDAYIELSRKAVPCTPPYLANWLTAAQARQSRSELQNILQQATDDLRGELNVVIAAMCLLNSRNCVDVQRPDLSRLNRRRKASGKRPLLSYSTVQINLSRRDAMAAKSDGMTQVQIRKHIVRGHFKLRSSGVFWWRPYIRGNGKLGEVKRAGYSVINRPEAA